MGALLREVGALLMVQGPQFQEGWAVRFSAKRTIDRPMLEEKDGSRPLSCRYAHPDGSQLLPLSRVVLW